MATYNFDDSNIQWSNLEGIEHLSYSILDVDIANKIVDVIFKLEPFRQIVLHRHMAVNHTFVIQGEHHLYELNGELKEIRAVGSYTTSPASEEPHRECGGEEGAVVLFSIRGSDGVFYEVLDDQKNLVATLGMQDFVDLFEANKKQQ
jgi:hypothetical protein